jgi:hypothetical protein
LSHLEVPFENPKARILCYVADHQLNGVGSIAEISRETRIGNVGETNQYVSQLISEGLLKKGDPRTDMTILKFTMRGYTLAQSLLPRGDRFLKIQKILAAALITSGIVSVSLLAFLPTGTLIIQSFFGIVFLAQGIYHGAILRDALRMRKSFLELEKSSEREAPLAP